MLDGGARGAVLLETRGDNLRAREKYWTKNSECVNQRVPGRTCKERYQGYWDRFRQYRENNAERTREWKSKVVQCECGSNVTANNVARHLRSSKRVQGNCTPST